jgi:hypothetical protein
MSELPRHSFHFTAWILSILLVPVLYMASVPWVDSFAFKHELLGHDRLLDHDSHFYRPYILARDNVPGAKPLLFRYTKWVFKITGGPHLGRGFYSRPTVKEPPHR